METNLQEHKHNYIAVILQGLHLTMDTFVYNLVHYGRYEIILYCWIIKLYQKQVPTDQAIQQIYKARNIFLLRAHENGCKKLQTNTLRDVSPPFP